MPRFPNSRELHRIAKTTVLAGNPSIDPDVIDREGTDANMIIAAGAGMGEAVAAQIAHTFQSLFITTANDETLDLLLFDRFGLARKDSTASIGQISFSRPNATYGAFVVPTGAIVNSSTPGSDLSFRTLEPATFSSSATGPITVDAIATESGRQTNALTGIITAISTGLEDSSTTATNSQPFVGGSEIESNESFRGRGLRFFETARRGTLSAIQEGALTVDGVINATASEKLFNGIPVGQVDLIIADHDGKSNSAMTSQFPGILDEYRPAGIYVKSIAGTQNLASIQVAPTYKEGVSVTDKRNAIKSSIEATVNALKPGKTLEISMIIKAVLAVTDVFMPDTGVSLPLSDIIPSEGETIRTSVSLVTVNGL